MELYWQLDGSGKIKTGTRQNLLRQRGCRICVICPILVVGAFVPFNKHTLSTHCVWPYAPRGEGPAGFVTSGCWL